MRRRCTHQVFLISVTEENVKVRSKLCQYFKQSVTVSTKTLCGFCQYCFLNDEIHCAIQICSRKKKGKQKLLRS